MAIAGLIGAVVSGIGSIVSGVMMAKSAEWNARRMEEEAQRERAAGAVRGMLKEREGERLASRARAVAGAQGAVTTTGTPLLLETEIAEEADFNARVERANAANRARSLENQAIATRFEGKVRKVGSFFSAGSSILGGIGDYAKQSGGFG